MLKIHSKVLWDEIAMGQNYYETKFLKGIYIQSQKTELAEIS